jgi:hypothetical protein
MDTAVLPIHNQDLVNPLKRTRPCSKVKAIYFFHRQEPRLLLDDFLRAPLST